PHLTDDCGTTANILDQISQYRGQRTTESKIGLNSRSKEAEFIKIKFVCKLINAFGYTRSVRDPAHGRREELDNNRRRRLGSTSKGDRKTVSHHKQLPHTIKVSE